MRVRVTHSAVINAPIDRVWAALRDFGGHGQWHPDMPLCRVENDLDGDVVGCVRRCRIGEDAEVREQLLRHSDLDHSYAYAVIDSPLPLFDNVTTLGLKPVTDAGQTFLHWTAQFRTSGARAGEMKALIGGRIFEAGCAGLRSFLADQEAPTPPPVMEEKAAVVAAGEPVPGRVVVVEAAGGVEALALRDESVPAPEPGQVRIRQKAVAVNFIDVLYRRGLVPGANPPGTPGLESVGEILDVGGRVDGLFPGDRVAYVGRNPGAYADVRLVEARDCVPLPDGVSYIQASTLLKGLTAGLLLGRIFRAAPGASILIESVSGGLGHILCQWARYMDMLVLGTVSTEAKARFARDLGCDHPILVNEGQRVRDEVMRITNGRGADFLVHDGRTVGLGQAAECLARFGHLTVIGQVQEAAPALPLDALRKRSLTLSAPDCLDYLEDRLYRQRSAHNYFAKLQSRAVIPAVEAFPLDRAGEAQTKIESRQNLGALALTVGS